MAFVGKAAPLDLDGLNHAAALIGADAISLWSLVSVETKGCGFLPTRQPKILFERHIFSRCTQGRFDSTDPDISNPEPGGYGDAGAHQFDRLASAMALDEMAALESASWGIGQIMGFQAVALGYPDAKAMVNAMCDDETEQLIAVVRYLSANGIAVALANQRWTDVARGYNGKDYVINQYDTKLASYYAALSASGLPDLRVRATQMLLSYLGFDPNGVDGVFGRMSIAALNAFQAQRGLAATDGFDEGTFAALQSAVAGLPS